MKADGTWTITMKTPLGAQVATLQLSTKGAGLTGTITSRLGSGPLIDGSVDGQTLTWTCAMKLPMPLTARFRAMIDADAITGQATLGNFGDAPFKGSRS